MKYLVTAQEMKQYDKNTIEYLGIPGPVLMERAALAAEDFIKERFDAVKERTKVLIFAGMGEQWRRWPGVSKTSCGGRIRSRGKMRGRYAESYESVEIAVADFATFSGEDRQ